MINNYGKLLFSAFIVIIVGVVLLIPIGDDVEEVQVSSIAVPNETLSFTSVTRDVSNGSYITGNDSAGFRITLNHSDLTVMTEIRNDTATAVTSECNVTLFGGTADCNMTNSSTLYFEYTYVGHRTETLVYDEIVSVTNITNATSEVILGYCNVTLTTGGLVCNNTYNATGYIAYSYEPDTYVHSGAARTLIDLIPLFFVLFILAVGVGYAWKSFKEGGVI